MTSVIFYVMHCGKHVSCYGACSWTGIASAVCIVGCYLLLQDCSCPRCSCYSWRSAGCHYNMPCTRHAANGQEECDSSEFAVGRDSWLHFSHLFWQNRNIDDQSNVCMQGVWNQNFCICSTLLMFSCMWLIRSFNVTSSRTFLYFKNYHCIYWFVMFSVIVCCGVVGISHWFFSPSADAASWV